MSVDVQAFRRDLFGLLDQIAADNVIFPGDLPELLCMWFDDHWHRPEEHVRDGILSEQEYQLLSRFSKVLRTAYPKHAPVEELDVHKLQDDPTWQSVVRAARQTKVEIRELRRST